MSSMRNAIQRRPYRERAQPGEREKWGLLEKHKDYQLRARSHRAQRDNLKRLRNAAKERNPDEFYFSMMNTKTSAKDGTRLGDRGNKSLSTDAVRLLKTQDAGYLRIMGDKARKESARLKEKFLGSGDKVDGAEKMRFVEGDEERVEEVARLKRGGEASANDGETDREKEKEKSERRMEASKNRYEQIMAAERELEDQRARMEKHRSVGGTNNRGVKWRIRERKK
ncbi:MAG: hypothetical protein M4579_001116 [Chaenotheca gracillima]|nr:MAG: hypothetical protein M4579_001116 [Chaenotheca gracillima]